MAETIACAANYVHTQRKILVVLELEARVTQKGSYEMVSVKVKGMP